MKRRSFLIGAGVAAAAAAAPFAMSGVDGFLRRVVRAQFGDAVAAKPGVDEFISAYVGEIQGGSAARRAGAHVYFALGGDMFYKPGSIIAFQERFLQTLLTRSNVIAIYQGREDAFTYGGVNPWEPECGLYLSALAEI